MESSTDNVGNLKYVKSTPTSKQQYNNLNEEELLKEILDGFHEIVFLLDEDTRIVAFNEKARFFFHNQSDDQILGNRFGNVAYCVHALSSNTGCGTTKFCTVCGAANSIQSVKNHLDKSLEECRLITLEEGLRTAHDFEVFTKKTTIDNKNYIMTTFKDISAEKRKDSLEKIFFHDALNTMGAVLGISELIEEADTLDEVKDLSRSLNDSANQLLNEIYAQREIFEAENGNLNVHRREKTINFFLKNIKEIYSNHPTAKNKNLVVNLLEEDIKFTTDITLLIRSLSNLVKNALEASNIYDTVRISAKDVGGFIEFSIWNNVFIPKEISLQIFKRSFSTRAEKGRGLGTYSVRLLVEHYLKGIVSFTTDEVEKTTFTIKIPKIEIR